jgi:hypothetical protein
MSNKTASPRRKRTVEPRRTQVGVYLRAAEYTALCEYADKTGESLSNVVYKALQKARIIA